MSNLTAALTALHTMLESEAAQRSTIELLDAARQADAIAARCRTELANRRYAAAATPTGTERLYRQRDPGAEGR